MKVQKERLVSKRGQYNAHPNLATNMESEEGWKLVDR
jgi:hypothetical protein